MLMRTSLAISLLTLGLSTGLLAADAPNVLVIVADDLGFSALGENFVTPLPSDYGVEYLKAQH